MDKLKLHTPDFVEANAAKLAELFPNCVTESRAEDGSIKRAIDFDLLRQELSGDLVEGVQERYRLDWPGKRESLALANAPITKTLRPCKEESVDFETTRNLYIEGDNLDALKLLQETYLNQVKMIYIDPPYNTGNDFIYDDNFSMSREDYEDEAGERDEEGNAMFDEEKWKQNSSASGRFHSEWVSMMYPRLKLARNLLQEDGVILVSIDDGEVANLIKIGNEVFGEQNFVGNFVWEGGRKNDAKLVSNSHDFICCWVKSRDLLTERNVRWRERKAGLDDIYKQESLIRKRNGKDFEKCRADLNEWFRSLPKDHGALQHKHFSYFDQRGLYAPADLRSPNPRPNLVYDWKGYKPHKNGWAYAKERMARMDAEDRLHYPASSDGRIALKSYLHEHETWAPSSVFYQDRRASSKRLSRLLGKGVFPFSKDENVIKRFIKSCAAEDSLVVDFFSGSGTTAHSVIQLNAEDGGNRRYIAVQLPEPCEEKSEAFKAGYSTISDIGKDRIRKAGSQIREGLQASLDGELKDTERHQEITRRIQDLDIGFRVLKIDSSNMADVYYQPDEVTQDGLDFQVDNLKDGREPEDLLFQVLLDWGVDLGLPITEEVIEGRRVFFVADNALAACFDTGLTEDFCKTLAKREPLRAVFRDAGYASDSTKINIEQIFKALSPHTELKTL
ncbi:site-specific DNA-methyltransferase [Haloferula helveola]|uniref:site-specific DNA-methyltransferase (adenine-specific) n=1 Tax=Haloferula helveola TaxID=490095 RepID=A0ABM7RI75_9BACT|nr:site-specific DNA-methyltransferase [Haloferula helveola]